MITEINKENRYLKRCEALRARVTELSKEGICQEMIRCRMFENRKYHLLLHKYYYFNEYYEIGKFDEITLGYGRSAVFRRHLREFAEAFDPVLFDEEKKVYLCLNKKGIFYLEKMNNDIDDNKETANKKLNKKNGAGLQGRSGKVLKLSKLDGDKKKDFEFQCYLAVNRFWDEVTALKNIFAEKLDLIY